MEKREREREIEREKAREKERERGKARERERQFTWITSADRSTLSYPALGIGSAGTGVARVHGLRIDHQSGNGNDIKFIPDIIAASTVFFPYLSF